MRYHWFRTCLAVGVLFLVIVSVSVSHAQVCRNNLPPSNPDSVYVDHGDGTVSDVRTGLMWQRCPEGLSGAGCALGSAQTFSWVAALGRAESSTFAGYTDWRLPNIKELSSLVEECRLQPAINDSVFPNTHYSLSSYYWSSSPSANSADILGDYAWRVHFDDGTISQFLRRNTYRIRLVRGGK